MMTDERIAEQGKAADAALRETLTRLVRDDGRRPVSVVIVLAHLLGEIAVDDAATHHGVHDAERALGPVLRQGRQAGRAGVAQGRPGRAAASRSAAGREGRAAGPCVGAATISAAWKATGRRAS